MDTTLRLSGNAFGAMLSRLLFRLNQYRLNLHFLAVIGTLTRRDVAHLTSKQRENRAQCLRWLEEYRKRAVFPVNTNHPGQFIPYFKDIYGTHCAVGYLMHRSGRNDLVDAIVHMDNNVRVRNIRGGPALVWMNEWGLTKKEAAWIQPQYGCNMMPGGCPPPTFSSDLATSVTTLIPYLLFAILEYCAYMLLKWMLPERKKLRWVFFVALTMINLIAMAVLFTFLSLFHPFY